MCLNVAWVTRRRRGRQVPRAPDAAFVSRVPWALPAALSSTTKRRHGYVTPYVTGTNNKWRSRIYCDAIFAVRSGWLIRIVRSRGDDECLYNEICSQLVILYSACYSKILDNVNIKRYFVTIIYLFFFAISGLYSLEHTYGVFGERFWIKLSKIQ